MKVQAVAFSPDEKYLASMGGQDDNALVRLFPFQGSNAFPGHSQSLALNPKVCCASYALDAAMFLGSLPSRRILSF